ncbi:hypothetical protein BsWGS_14778 [Bradybaena similaris]
MTLQQIGIRLSSLLYNKLVIFYIILTWPLRKLHASLIYMADYMFSKTISTLQKLLFVWSVIIVLVVVSLMLYATFYTSYVPTAEISRPVHLAFSVCSSGVGICSFPSGNVTFWNEDGTIQEGLGPGQPYTVHLVLEMPDSQANRDLGMFMLVVKMYDSDGYISAVSQRSTIFRYRSVFMRAVHMTLLSPLYFLGILEQKKTLTAELFSHFVDDYYHQSVGATVEIHSHKIELYSATLIISAKFTGLKYLLHNWPLLSAVCAFWFNLLILAVGVTAVVLHRESQRRSHDIQVQPAMEEEAEDLHETSRLQTINLRNTRDEGTQTKQSEEDDPETYDLPLVQEPIDFPIPQENEELFQELRQRRVN